MIWFTIALFAVSFLATALLAPKPELENARAQDLDPNSFPQSSENSPIAVVLGRGRVNGPNTLYYGGFRAVPIREKVKTGLFSSTTITKGYKYYLTADMGICLGPNVWLEDIYVDEEAIEAGTETNVTEGYTFFEDESDGIEDSRGGAFTTATTVPFDVDFPAGSADPNPTVYNLADLGITSAQVDAGELTVSASYEAAAGGAFSTDNVTCILEVEFFDAENAGGAEFTLDNIFDSEIANAPIGSFGASVFPSVTGAIPIGTRSIRVKAAAQILIPANTAAAAQNHLLTVEGPFTFYESIDWEIYEPELFGGDENGGGLIGDYTFYPGTFDQGVDADVEALVGVGNVPAYRGLSHAVFKDLYIGESPNMRKTAFDVRVYTTNLENVLTDPSYVRIGADDINPAEALYEILTSKWRGLGIPSSLIDIDSFAQAGDTLASENFGITVVTSGAMTGKKLVSEILRTVDGIMFQEPTTGKFTLKLIREDYNPASLVVYDESDITKIDNLSKLAWEDVVSEVKVSFSSRSKEDGKIALAQDMAVANMIGRRKTSTVSYPFIYDPDVAAFVATRELSQLSVPLLKMTMEMDRSGYNIKPGDVFKVSWPEYGLSEIVMRASKYDTGELLNNKVVIECVEDKFAVGTVVFAAPADSAWTDPVPLPNDIAAVTIVEMPYFMTSRLDYPTADGYGNIIPFPVNPDSTESTEFTMKSGVVSGSLDITEPERKDYPVTGLLAAQLLETDGFETGIYAAGVTITSTIGIPTAATASLIADGEAGLMYANGEWMAYEGVTDNGGGSYTLANVHRGLLGTTPKTHPATTRFFIHTPDLLGTGILGDVLLEDGTAYYKLLDIAGDITQDPSAVSEDSFVLADLADRPLRPRNLQIDSSRGTVPHDAAGNPTFTLSWNPSNRAAATIPDETDTAETPDQTEEYDVQVWIDGVDQSGTYGFTSIAGTSQAMDLTGASGSTGYLRVISRRTSGDTKESAYSAFYPFSLSLSFDNDEDTFDSDTVSWDAT